MTPRTATEGAAAARSRLRAGHMAVVVAIAGIVVLWQMAGFAAPVRGFDLPWWGIALGFAVAEAGAIHLRVRRDAHSISLVEVPLLFGLASLSPLALVSARLVGETAALVVWRRQRGEKLLFNLCLFLLETAAALSIYHGVLLGADPVSPRGWVAAAAAMTAAIAVGAGSVTVVLRLHEPHRSFDTVARSLLSATAISMGSGLLALVALILVSTTPWTGVLLGIVGSMLFVGLRVFESLFRRHHALEAVHSFSESVGATLEVDVILHDVLAEARRVFHVSDALLLWQDGDDFRRLHSRADGGITEIAENRSLAAGLLEAENSLVPIRLGDADAISDYAASVGITGGLGIRLAADAPGLLIIGNGRGALAEFDAEDSQLLETVARHSVAALERARLLNDVRHQAAEREHESLHDALTGLPNRLSFTAAIDAALADRDPDRLIAVAIVDLDRFKEINDTLGHQHGDIVLSEIADRLGHRVRDADVVARLGGDEFGILVSGLRTASAALGWTRRISDSLAQPLEYDGLSLVLSGSVGLALAPEHGTDAATLLRRADVAMYAAKRLGTSVEVYQLEHDPHSTRRLTIIGELGPAIETGQLVVYYQPKVRLSDGAVTGIEALVRWQHPRLGLLPPPDFIELAETTGLIGPLTNHVLETAVTDVAKLNADGHDLSVSVNIAPRCLADGGLPETVFRTLGELGVPADHLILEITETTGVADSASSIAALELLSELGVRLSVDDFGTGYSSMAYLTSLPVDEIKIDRSFVGDMDTVTRNARIVESSISLARGIGLTVVAEGVETEGAWYMLRDLGCDTAQGFLLGRPVPLPRLREWLEEFVPPE